MAFVDKTIEVEADVREVYDAWTAFEEYPEFMELIERVDVVDEDELHWTAIVEDDLEEWDADVVEHVPEQSVAWQAVDGRESGQVKFDKVGDGKTRVHYQLEYDPEAWEDEPRTVEQWMQQRVDSDLQSFKEVIEGKS